jgi:hypothetical protein
MPDFAIQGPQQSAAPAPDGTFEEAGDRPAWRVSRPRAGAALADFNLDGLRRPRRRQPPFRRASCGAMPARMPATGCRSGLDAAQPAPNRDAIGAWIEVRRGDRTMRRETFSAAGPCQRAGRAGGISGWAKWLGRFSCFCDRWKRRILSTPDIPHRLAARARQGPPHRHASRDTSPPRVGERSSGGDAGAAPPLSQKAHA